LETKRKLKKETNFKEKGESVATSVGSGSAEFDCQAEASIEAQSFRRRHSEFGQRREWITGDEKRFKNLS